MGEEGEEQGRNIRAEEEQQGRGSVQRGDRRRKQRRRTGICIHVPTLRRRSRLLLALAHAGALRDGGRWRDGEGGKCVFHLLSCA